jgi:hypothetical protein
MKPAFGKTSMTLSVAVLALGVASCNAAVGGGLVVLLGGVGVLASQCYDRVRVRVRDPETGLRTCDADVTVVDADGSSRQLRSCYSAALTAGKWRIVARQEGYVASATDFEIQERDGACPNYTHTVELSLRREGAPAESSARRAGATPAPATTPAPSSTSDLESPPARVVPPPLPGVPMVPTRAFDPIAPAAPAVPAAPSPPTAPAPTSPAAPPPTPAPAPAPAPQPSPPR